MSIIDIKEFFNNISPYWNNTKDDINVIKSLLQEAGIKKSEDTLDLGCGKGIITPLIYEITKQKVVAIDVSNKMIDAAKALHNSNNYEFICDDFYIHNFNTTFDNIIIYNAYPHFLDVDLLAKKCYSLLNDDGKLVIMHSLGRNALNDHHSNITKISRNIDTPEQEYNYFKKYFTLEKAIDEENRILILLKKKN